MNNKKMSISKPIASISEICEMVGLSRARFYQLLQSGFFPKPLQDERSKRPYYDLELQQKILESRQSGIGVNGSFMLFYSPRKSEAVSQIRKKKVDPKVQELTDTLVEMGLDVSVQQVQDVLEELFPEGVEKQDQGIVIRNVYRHLKQKM